MQIARLAVPTFFAISGALYFKNLTKHTWKKKIRSRFFTTVIPMLIWNELAYLFSVVLSSIPAIAKNLNSKSAELSIKGILLEPIFGKNNMVTWYLRALISYFVISLLLAPIIKNKKIGWIPCIMALIVSEFIKIGDYSYISSFAFFSLAGYLQSCSEGRLLTIHYRKWMSISSAMISVLLVLIRTVLIVNGFSMPTLVSNTLYIIQIGLLWIAMDLFEYKKPHWILCISFFIYCIHNFILEPIQKIIWITIGDNALGAIVDYCCSPLLTIVIIVLVAFVLKRLLPKTWKLLSGGRG